MKQIRNETNWMPQEAVNLEVEPQKTVDTRRILLCDDGKYRWTYEVNLYTNAAILSDLLKVMTLSCGIVYAMMAVFHVYDGFDAEVFWSITQGFFWITVGMWGLSLIGYLVYALFNGGRYAAMFEMDEEGVIHCQMEKQMKRNQVMALITGLVGVATGKPTVTGNALLAATRNATESSFRNVRQVKPVRRRHLIKVNERLMHNRVYVEDPEDFEFVLDYIRQRCPKIK